MQRDAIQNVQRRLYEDAMVTRRDYENARKNASRENTKVSDDKGCLNQQLNMDWGWLRNSSGVGPFSLTGTSRFPDFELPHASQIRAASRLPNASRLPFLVHEELGGGDVVCRRPWVLRGKDATTGVPRGASMLLPRCLVERVSCFSGVPRERRTYFVVN